MTQTAVAEIASSGIDLFLVAGEESGDQLGAALMRALRVRTGGRVSWMKPSSSVDETVAKRNRAGCSAAMAAFAVATTCVITKSL